MSMADDIMVMQFEARLRRSEADTRNAPPAEAQICRDHPDAYEAAYDSLVTGGIVKHAQIRSEIARRVLVVLVPLANRYGAAYMETIASGPTLRLPLVSQVWDGVQAESRTAVDEAIAAAARVLAGIDQLTAAAPTAVNNLTEKD